MSVWDEIADTLDVALLIDEAEVVTARAAWQDEIAPSEESDGEFID